MEPARLVLSQGQVETDGDTRTGSALFIERCRALRKSKRLLEINGVAAAQFEKFHLLDRQVYARGAREPSVDEWSLLNELESLMAPQITPQIRTQLLARSARRTV